MNLDFLLRNGYWLLGKWYSLLKFNNVIIYGFEI